VGALDRSGDRSYGGAVGFSIRSSFVVAAVVLVLLGAAVGVGAATNNISTVAGTGMGGFAGDGGAAAAAQLEDPSGVAATADGGFLIADTINHRVRRVSPGGIISTVAGTGTGGFSGDDAAATSAQLNVPRGVAVTADGGFLIADTFNNRVRRVSPAGTISTVAGNGTRGFAGDGGAATSAQLNFPRGVAASADGGFLIADTENSRVRRVSPAGTISTVAGTATAGFAGDGGAATSAQLDSPRGVAASADGGFLIADTGNERVRRVSRTGTISTVAGNGMAGFAGDGSAATSAQLNFPFGVAASADGGFLIADTFNNRVRRVSPAGTISTVAGTATAGFAGDGGAATSAQLRSPLGVALAADGDYLIADTDNDRVRRVDAGDPPPVAPPPVAPPSSPPPVAMKAVISKISLSPRSPRAKSARKAMLSFTLNVAKRVTVRLDRILPGRKNGRRCVKPTLKNRTRRKCKRAIKVAARTVAAKPGVNRLTLAKLAGKKKLRRGSYRITLSAPKTAKKTVAFKIRR